MAIKYRTETGVTIDKLEELANDEGWALKQVLHSRDAGGQVTMVVLLSKSIPDNVSGMMRTVEPPKPRRGRPPREKATT